MQKLSMDALARLTPDEFRAEAKTPIVIVYDNVRSALNVGSAFRTADAFRLEAIVLCGITAQPPHKEILKTALGATETVAWTHYAETTDALQALRSKGYTLIAIEQTAGSTSLEAFAVQPDACYALVLGNEVDGVSSEALALCDGCIEIPQIGTKHSLNISVCAGIVVWDLFKQMMVNTEKR